MHACSFLFALHHWPRSIIFVLAQNSAQMCTGDGVGAGVALDVGLGVGAGNGLGVMVGIGVGLGPGIGLDVGTSTGLGVGSGVASAAHTAARSGQVSQFVLSPWHPLLVHRHGRATSPSNV